MRIASAATALPKHRYNQQTILQALKFHWASQLEQPDMLDRLHARTGVDTRFLAMPIEIGDLSSRDATARNPIPGRR